MTQVVEITEAASFQVKEMMRHNEEEGSFLRVAVKGGGCSGLTYGMGFEPEVAETDDQYEQHGVRILINKEDAPILQGTVVDYKQSLMGGGFTIDNPNAIASCGCGTSFRTAKKAGTPENC
ncbi:MULTISPECIES: iron-sulfur cluster assembly accessory protein [unclassified Planococcus (in: firmicutes)]|uniref:HesB/IscA family protein n=1 Tax=unclassified Planococcus (in: firmicutes) TaxID=2662419 RepID=UPI000C31D8A8|nr:MULTISPECIES: iron-sulfur cluster assembly accessory protein [unclassified Planococcus (in: firmicutes)]AUD13513.1 iron-sulfur cluster assembly accessory protein [Planococcus sp. MB-3u-03]PKG46059.1 iron-sulfur cluster assembly accessory protein [Planococcus sp. Urea-trap-24]PKG89952.1 iron-sulfur cluster assembly accessory protein [Planococcus sp. Urea-3u-39]PKH40573.1 iron-sulfur cluster assembly accessory protein [Planococcus sp. MB-3u-09]